MLCNTDNYQMQNKIDMKCVNKVLLFCFCLLVFNTLPCPRYIKQCLDKLLTISFGIQIHTEFNCSLQSKQEKFLKCMCMKCAISILVKENSKDITQILHHV